MHLDLVQTLALGVIALALGDLLNRKIRVLRRVCIPSPVSGGLTISLLILLLHSLTGMTVTFDSTLKDVCMLMFFTSVGLRCNLSVLKQGGRHLAVLVLLVAALIVLQNVLSVGMSRLMGVSPLLGMTAGSITMCGGHGTAGGFSALLENKGLAGAETISMAAATFGLLGGSLMGGPLGSRLISRCSLSPLTCDKRSLAGEGEEAHTNTRRLAGTGFVALVAGAGTLVNKLFVLAGITVPTYFGALLLAIAVRNLAEAANICPKLPLKEAERTGDTCLALFLGVAMVSLKLWELAGIALPLLAILSAQIALMYAFARFAAFPLLGRDYDAAVLVGGLCGFGLGATPNALANMDAICRKHGYSALPFIVVPIVGAAFVDVINVTVITTLLNLV